MPVERRNVLAWVLDGAFCQWRFWGALRRYFSICRVILTRLLRKSDFLRVWKNY